MNKNIPAFPGMGPEDLEEYNAAPGMTLRDYFAGQALSGELASQTVDAEWPEASIPKLAKRCYSIADAMLAEREGGEK